jgi:hypothetical protein
MSTGARNSNSELITIHDGIKIINGLGIPVNLKQIKCSGHYYMKISTNYYKQSYMVLTN